MTQRLRSGFVSVFVAAIVTVTVAANAADAAAQGSSGTCADSDRASTGPKIKKIKMFRDQPFFDPLQAEEHAARVQLVIPAWSSEFPHSETKGNRFAWQITLGRELPIFTLSSQVGDGPMDCKKWGIGIWTPVSFHMIEDFADESNPIVDTDYRFGSMIKFQYGLTDTLRLGIRYVPWAHESTHLGDEYVIIAQRSPDFERINVSYEYQSYGISLEGDGPFGENDSFVIRHGGIKPHGKDGYYSDHLLGSEETRLTTSRKNFEPSFGAEYTFPEWRERRAYVSFELRNALVYTYHQTPDNPERRQWTWNLQVGRTLQPNDRKALKSYFFQVHRGVNPYGQLRSQADYWSAGFGWIFGF